MLTVKEGTARMRGALGVASRAPHDFKTVNIQACLNSKC